MELRRNILFSLIFHITIITAVFSVIGRDRVDLVSVDYMIVSLFKEMTGITSMASHSTKKVEDKILPPPFPPLPDPPVAEQAGSRGGRVREGVYKDKIASPEPTLSRKIASTDFVSLAMTSEGARNDNPSHQSLRNTVIENAKGDTSIIVEHHEGISGEINISNSTTKDNESNPPSPPFSKGGKVGLSGEITSSQNTGFSTIKSSYKGSTNNPYDLIRSAIEKVKTYPFLARKKRIEGTVITGFTINSKGYPQHIKVEKSSGSEILDSAAIKIIMKAAPFPEVNDEIIIPITFKLTDSP